MLNNKVCDINNNLQAHADKNFKIRLKHWLKKYFMEGQKLNDSHEKRLQSMKNLPFSEKYRKYIAFLLPFVFMHTVWWTLAIRYNIFRLYPNYYQLAVTMIFGATVAGATAEGGGAIAFPVMTILLNIDSKVARDFSLMIQSCGMVSASFTIIWMKVQVEWFSIVFCSLGALFSIIIGIEFIDDFLSGSEKKMLFVAIWFSFAISLFILNTEKKRKTVFQIENVTWWKCLILFCTGIFGGFCTALSGSGVDISSFSILTLLFRVNEKVANPTSVILMAINTLIGFFWRQLIDTDISDQAWIYFQTAVPVVVIFAPFGAFISSHLHRLVLASFVYVLEFLTLIGFLVTLPPYHLVIIMTALILFGAVFFFTISKIGKLIYEMEKNIINKTNCTNQNSSTFNTNSNV